MPGSVDRVGSTREERHLRRTRWIIALKPLELRIAWGAELLECIRAAAW